MSFNIYSYRSKGSPNNKNSQKILRGFGKSSWIIDTEYLPWDSKETYHEDYRLIRKLFNKSIDYLSETQEYKNIFTNPLYRRRQTLAVSGMFARFLVIQIIQTLRECDKWKHQKIAVHDILRYPHELLRPPDLDRFFSHYICNPDWVENLKILILLYSKRISEEDINYNPMKLPCKTSQSFFRGINTKKIIYAIAAEVILFTKKIFSSRNILFYDQFVFAECNFFSKDCFTTSWILSKFSFSNMLFRRSLSKSSKNEDTSLTINSSHTKNSNNEEEFYLEIFKQLWNIYAPTSLSIRLKESLKRARQIFPSKAPDFICTSTAFYKDELFNLYTADSIAKNSKYIIIQHGGGYGFSEFNDEEEYQLSVADMFLSWGWKQSKVTLPEIYPKAVIEKFGASLLPKGSAKRSSDLPVDTSAKNTIYVAMAEWTFCDFRLYSYPTSHGQKSKQKYLIKMINLLSNEYRKKVSIRLHLNGRYNLLSKLRQDIPFFKFRDRTKSLLSDDILLDTRIFVSDSNSTALLELLSMNIPTIILLGKELEDHAHAYLPLMNRLEKARILFNSPSEMAYWLDHNYDNITDWWSSEEVQTIRKEFLEIFASKPLLNDDSIFNQINSYLYSK